MTASKTLLGLIGIILFFFWLTCFKLISPGYVGVVVDMMGEDKGVETKELRVGAHWIAPWKSVYEFPIFEQNLTWEGDEGFNFQTRDGMAVHGDVGITFHLRPDCVPTIFQRYRRGMDEISNLFVRNYIRDALNTAASKVAIEDLYGAGKEEFFRQVQLHVQRDLEPIGIDISRIYIIGRLGFPQGIITALNAKIEATQRAQQRENELREAEAEAKKQVAKAEGQAKCLIADANARAQSHLVQAEAEAKANTLLAQSISLQLTEWHKVQKWNGVLPQVCGQNTPFINIGL